MTPWVRFDLFHKISYLHIYMSSLILMKFLVMINVLDESVEFWWNKNQTKHENTRPYIFPVDGQVRHLKPGLIRQSAITNIKIFIYQISLEPSTSVTWSLQSFFLWIYESHSTNNLKFDICLFSKSSSAIVLISYMT